MLDTMCGSYRITEKLAQGGMGAVYLAHHELMERDAVVKVLHPRFSHDTEMVSRFFNEARAAASIHHPGIVEIFDVGYADERAFIVMERLRGQTLAARMRERPVPMSRAVSLVRQIAGALGAAHARGIVHRDLKPENIFIVIDPEVPGGERVKLLDFGIAKLAEPRDGVMTAQGSLFGTPAYMAPEQCSDAATVDHRADLYAVGCILYQLLTGQPPFGKGGLELLAAHLRDTPTPVGERVEDVPDELDALTMRLLHKEPDGRYATCKAFVEALDELDLASLPPVPGYTTEAAASLAPTVASAATGEDISLQPTQAASSAAPGDATAFAATMSSDQLSASAPGDAPDAPDAPDSAHMPSAASASAPAPAITDRISERAAPTSTGRRNLFLAALVVLVAAGALALFLSRSERSPSTSESTPTKTIGLGPATTDPAGSPNTETAPPPAEHKPLDDAEAHLQARQWALAIAAASRVPESSDTHARAQAIVERASREIVHANLYQQFVAAIDDTPAKALALYRQLPEDSAYHGDARPRYQETRDAWIAEQLTRAENHARKNRCKRVASIRDRLAKHSDDDAFQDAVARAGRIASSCKGRKKATSAATTPEVPDFDAAQARTALRAMRKAFAGCLVSPGGRKGVITVTVLIGASGKVRSVNAAHSDAKVRQCLRQIGMGLTFPRSKTGGHASTTVFY